MARHYSSSSSCVKLYLCSNPQDSVVERKALREGVFPRIREHCRHTLGLDLRVIDPFESSDCFKWPDENTRKQLIKECRESSAGPYLLALVGHQYGTGGLPAQVEVSEYQLLLQESQGAGISTVELERVYSRDENTLPPSYCLRSQVKVKELDKTVVADAEENCKKLFQTAVSLCVHNGAMTPEKARSYCRSALDVDLRYALDDSAPNDISGRCLVYIHKVITGKAEKGQTKSHQFEVADTSEIISEEALLSELCDHFLLGLVTSCNLLVYNTTTECRSGYTTARRRCYADSLGQQVYSDLVKLTDSLDISNHCSPLTDAFAREQAEQEELCTVLSRFYEVIQPEEEEIRAYMQNDQWCPLVVTGGPCAGKTVLLAHCSQRIKSWLQDSDPVVITYFCNLSVDPSPKHLLSSLCYQIGSYFSTRQDPTLDQEANLEPNCYRSIKEINSSCIALSNFNVNNESSITEHVTDFGVYSTDPDMSLSELKKHLSILISSLPSHKQPLVLLLDGLDQMENNFGLQIIASFPSPLPARVKLLLTVSSNRKHIVQAMELHYPQCIVSDCESEVGEKSGFLSLQLGQANRKECIKMLASLLCSSGRRITSGQQALVNQALTSCCLTLYVRLLHVHASLWRSDSEVTESSSPDSIHSSISGLLDHLEHKHGHFLTAHALCFLTLSRTGLTEAELTDLLSSDDKVLAGYVERRDSSSSKVRVPQVDVERLLLDLKPFLIKRTVAGSQVLFWVCRHFGLVTARRYLRAPQTKREFNSEMADYFNGRWSCGCSKPLQLNQGCNENKIYIDRQPSSQPFFFTSSPQKAKEVNLRKILELPYHLKESDRFEELQHKLLMTLAFHQAMIQAGLFVDLVAMLDREEEDFSKERSLLANILKSSVCFLKGCPSELPSVMEMTLLPYKEVLPALEGYIREITQERKRRGFGVTLYPAPSAVPSFKRVKTQAGNRVKEAVVTQCGVVAQTMDDGSVWVWKGSGRESVQLSLSCEQEEVKFRGVKSSGRFILLSSRSNEHFLWDTTGTDFLLEVKDSEPSRQTPKTIENFVACQEMICAQWKDESFVSFFEISSGTMTHFHCQSPVTCLAFSSGRSYIYCGQDEGSVSICDTNTFSLVGTCSNADETIVSIIICEEKQQMGCVDRTGNITLWNMASKAPNLEKEMFSAAKTDIINTDYSSEIHTLLVCQSQQISLWDTCKWEESDQFLAPKGRTFTQALLSQDGHLFLALLDTCPFVLLWSLNSGQCVLSLENIASQVPYKLLKTASDVVSVSRDGGLTLWDSEMIYAAGIAPKMGCGVKEVVVEHDGEGFFTGDGSETVWRWSLKTRQPFVYLLHNGPVDKIRLSPDNVHLVTLSSGDIYIWKLESGENIMRISGSRASDILIAPNSNVGVSLRERGLSRVWKLVNGAVVCTIGLHLSDAQISAESTFLIGLHRGNLLAASLWSGTISKRFSCKDVVAFQTLSKHPDFVIVLVTSGSVYTWKVAEETVCKHFQLPYTLHCQPQDFQMSLDGSHALLSTDDETLTILDLSQFRLCSFKANGTITKACLDTSGGHVIYISHSSLEQCACYLHSRPVLTVIRLEDGDRVASLCLSKNPVTLAVYKGQCVVVGFVDGTVGVYYFLINGEEPVNRKEKLHVSKCPLDQERCTWLPLTAPNISWS